MRRLPVPFVGLLIAALLLPLAPVRADPGPELTAAQESRVQELVLETLRAHPEILVEMMTALRTREEREQLARRSEAVQSSQALLERAEGSPVVGNPDGDVTLVEFFDYRCGYCKEAAEPLWDLVVADGGIRLVLKELPILSPESEIAARIALAAERQGLYQPVHMALMRHKGSFDEATLLAVAAAAGADTARLRADMEAPEIRAEIIQNLELAARLELRGTPTFVIGDVLIPGAADPAILRQSVQAARAAAAAAR